MGVGQNHGMERGAVRAMQLNPGDSVSSSSLGAGCALLRIERVFRESTITTAYATSPMKLLAPRSRGPSAWVCTSSFGGGLVAGDQTRFDVQVGVEARCVIGTQASAKIYRNPERLPCSHTTLATLEPGSLLAFLPDPVQPFAGSIYSQRQKFHLAPEAGLVLLDWFSSGRAARGERWSFARFQTRNDVFVSGQRAFVDSTLLEEPENSPGWAHRSGRFNCVALLLLIGPPLRSFAERILSGMASSPVTRGGSLICSASPVGDGAVLRIAGEAVEPVGRELRAHLKLLDELLGDDPWERKY